MTKKLRFLMTALLFAVCGMTWAAEMTGTINFGSNGVKINGASVTGNDDLANTWTITTEGTTSFTSSSAYYQVGSSGKPATSITFTTTLPNEVNITSMSAKFGGFSGTQGDVTLMVGSSTIGSGSLNATDDVVVSSTSTATGKVLTVTVTNIAKGVKCYYISYTYSSEEKQNAVVTIDQTDLEVGETTTVTTNGPALTLSTDDTSVASVSGNTITAVGAGTATITASWEGNDEFNGGETTFEVTVTAPDPVEDGIFDFTGNNKYGSGISPSDSQTNIATATWIAGNVTLVTTSFRYWYNQNGNTLRIYDNGTVTVSVPEGYVITSIKSTGSQLATLTDNNNKGISSWSGSAQSVVFNHSGSAAQIKTITVTYQEAGEKSDATVTIGQTSLKVGQTTTVSTDGPALTLSTDDASVASVSGNTIIAEGAGTAIITATWEENDEFNGGETTFEVTVIAAATVEDGIFNFTEDLQYGTNITPSTDSNNIESASWVAGNVTLETTNFRYWYNTNGNTLRIYSGGSLTASVPEGYVITKIETTGKNLNLLKDATDNNISSWTGSAQSVEFNHGGGSAVQIEILTVTYEEETAPASITVSIPASGYASFCSQYAIEVEEDGVAFIATGLNNGKVRLQPVTGVIAKETGLIIKGSGSVDLAVSSEEGEAPEGNKLVGVLTATDMTGIECYILKDGAFWPCTGGTLAAGKAYLNIAPETVGGGTEGKILDIEEGIIDPTAISEIETTTENAAIYTLGGVRVKDAQQKGIYIINGKKVVK